MYIKNDIYYFLTRRNQRIRKVNRQMGDEKVEAAVMLVQLLPLPLPPSPTTMTTTRDYVKLWRREKGEKRKRKILI